MLIDVHCHLTGEEYEELGGADGVVQRANAEGVAKIVCSGFDLPSSKIAKTLAEKFDCMYFCAGFHPSELDKYRDGDLEEIAKLCKSEKCVAVGEIGLDYHFDDNPPKETQRRLFVEQLELADKLGLPVVLHSRDSAKETLDILTEHKALLKRGGLMHCYSYSPEMAEEFLSLGLWFSFGGPCTFKNAKKVCESVERIPLTRLLSETDCPYLTPVPFRGTFPNEPKNVKFVVEKLAELKGVTVEKMQEIIYRNAKDLFSKLK
ncbi:MAG: TatD family deoxyribonuclease [Clostridiales bacterium]|nr:TatD family deoxyribonuclease [Clostridiales bacterium]